MEGVNGKEELQLISRQHPREVSIDNFFEMKVALTHALARYENVVYTEDMLADTKADKESKEIDDQRKEVKKAYRRLRPTILQKIFTCNPRQICYNNRLSIQRS